MKRKRLGPEEVIRVALTIVKANGVDELTINRLAEALSVTPMAIYYYFENKDHLLSEMLDQVLSQVRIRTDIEWESALRELNLDVRTRLAQYPGLAGLSISMRVTPNGDRLRNALYQILLDAGFDPEDARLAFVTIQTYMIGRLALDDRYFRMTKSERKQAMETERAVVGTLVAVQEHPGAMYTDFGLRATIAGLEHLLLDNRSRKGQARSAVGGPRK